MKLIIRQDLGPSGEANTARPRLQPATLKPMRLVLRAVAAITKVGDGAEVSLLLCGDTFIRELNSQYRGNDSATDVLSFAQDDPVLLGDIVISVETASRQAEAAGWTLDSELALLASHGLLHLQGFEDETEQGAVAMETLSRTALLAARIALPREIHPFFTRVG